MTTRTKTLAMLLALPVALTSARAGAQEFPDDPAWEPLRCRGNVMTDVLGDEPDGVTERDLVGDGDDPAGFRAADDDYFYLRLRVDGDPMTGSELRPDAWGMAFDLDLDLQTYEVLVVADTESAQVLLYENTETLAAGDPTDPADLPEVAAYPFEDFFEVAPAGSLFGDDPDWFVDLAVPWADLFELGLEPASLVRAWVASSSAADRLDADFACHDRAGGGPSVDDVMSDEAVADPDATGDGGDDAGDGGDADGGDLPGDREIEGGGGCSAAASAGFWSPLIALAGLALLAGRRRRRSLCG